MGLLLWFVLVLPLTFLPCIYGANFNRSDSYSYDVVDPSDEENTTTTYTHFEGRIVVSNIDFLRFNFLWDGFNSDRINKNQLVNSSQNPIPKSIGNQRKALKNRRVKRTSSSNRVKRTSSRFLLGARKHLHTFRRKILKAGRVVNSCDSSIVCVNVVKNSA